MRLTRDCGLYRCPHQVRSPGSARTAMLKPRKVRFELAQRSQVRQAVRLVFNLEGRRKTDPRADIRVTAPRSRCSSGPPVASCSIRVRSKWRFEVIAPARLHQAAPPQPAPWPTGTVPVGRRRRTALRAAANDAAVPAGSSRHKGSGAWFVEDRTIFIASSATP